MKPYELYQLVQGYDKYNRPTKQDWEPLGITIQIGINFKDTHEKSEDVRYKESTHFGLTDYKGFDERCTYKLVDDLKEYEIKMINQVTRKTQLHLKELIANE
jgi:hypothetical protein